MLKLNKLTTCAIAAATIFGATVSDAAAQRCVLRGLFGGRNACVATSNCRTESACRCCACDGTPNCRCAPPASIGAGCVGGSCRTIETATATASENDGYVYPDCGGITCAVERCVAEDLRPTADERALFSAINARRAAYALPPLTFDSRETVRARHNSECCRRWGLGHWQIKTANEIVAAAPNAEAACYQWETSLDGRREVLLDKRVARLAVGVAKYDDKANVYTARTW